ncbi:uncharacterized protein LOC110822808 isoform X2 [Carica papaya]|uniref:uncharacterized protein LOC110822808 isoform X2 n=1 Tax=Carica papaya TaxID=3649 RepID=UPI000B8C72C2|nr:uncharacterized protein LOC110822808 isoform X2 [Carica papaya]
MHCERGLVLSTSSSSSPFNPPSSAGTSAEDAADMVADRTEMEAAEALADMAQLAMREKPAESPAKWGSKGKRVRKRVKSESSPSDSRLSLVDSAPPCPDLAEDQAGQSEQKVQASRRNKSTKLGKSEQDTELGKQTPVVPRCTSTGSGRSRQNLTEAEKEERRIRRVLANRESARQTIRRRQALCEELTQKAADLARENVQLKMISKATKPEAGQAVEQPPHLNISASPSTTYPVMLFNQNPLQPLCWPSVVQASHPIQSQHGPPTALVVPSGIPAQAPGNLLLSQEQENPVKSNGPRTPIYIVPCPWFFPLPDHGNGLHLQSSSGMKNMHDENSVNNSYSSVPSLKTITGIENHISHSPTEKVKEETSSSTESKHANDLNEVPAGFPHDGGSHYIGLHPKEMMLAPLPQSSMGPPFTFKQENVFPSDYVGHVLTVFPEKNQGTVDYSSKKMVDTVAAAEARKRRKELTKIKNLNSRQCRTPA